MGDWNFPGTYSKPGVVDNTPTPAGMSIALVGGNTIADTITFSTPVLNPILAIQSLGSQITGDQAAYDFAAPFTILQQGSGHWGGDSSSLWQVGNMLYGFEGNGILLFSGTYSSISWTVPDGENYHMFTVGAPGPAPIPEPASILLSGIGIASLAGTRIRGKKTNK
jgi:hypothetical protein